MNEPYSIGVDAEMKNITFSVGIAEYGGQSAEDLYDAADKATYHSKKAGKNTHTYYESSMEMSETLPTSEY
jgi:PleD family two-component response regulator